MPEGLSSQGHGDQVLLPTVLQQEAGFKGKQGPRSLEEGPQLQPLLGQAGSVPE